MNDHIYKPLSKEKNMRMIILLALVCCLILPLVNAQSIGTFKQASAIELTQVCTNETALCDTCNITIIKYPNSTINLQNIVMQKRTADFNYTLPSSKSTALGTYYVLGYCISGSQYQSWSYEFDVTTNGNANTMTLIALFLIIAFGLFMIGSYLRNEYVIFIAGATLLALGVYLMIYGFGSTMDLYTRILAFVSLGLGLFFTIAAAVHAIASTGSGWGNNHDDDFD